MPLESATYIHELVATNPDGGDQIATLDQHDRLIKAALLATFPGITGAVTATHVELNYVDGVTSGIQAQFTGLQAAVDLKAAIAGPTFTGTVTAPTLVVTTLATGPTEVIGSNNTRLATTAFVTDAVAGAVGGLTRQQAMYYGGD